MVRTVSDSSTRPSWLPTAEQDLAAAKHADASVSWHMRRSATWRHVYAGELLRLMGVAPSDARPGSAAEALDLASRGAEKVQSFGNVCTSYDLMAGGVGE